MPNTRREDGDWVEYRRLVLAELKRLAASIEGQGAEFKQLVKEVVENITKDMDHQQELYEELKEDNRKNREAILALNIKAGFWGAISGALVMLAAHFTK